jgi:septal ring factor EnvC (AmiA/AmiB activator)
MLELFGVELGTPFQGGTFLSLVVIAGLLVRVWIMGIPDRITATSTAHDKEITRHTEEIKWIREELRSCEVRDREKSERIDKVEDELREAKNHIGILENKLRSYGIDKVLMEGGHTAPHSVAAAQRLRDGDGA